MITPPTNGELVTDAVATAAITSPYWLPLLQATSTTFTMLWPILGGIWLVIQIFRALIQGWVALGTWRAKRKHK